MNEDELLFWEGYSLAMDHYSEIITGLVDKLQSNLGENEVSDLLKNVKGLMETVASDVEAQLNV